LKADKKSALNKRLTRKKKFDDEWGKIMKPKEGCDIVEEINPRKSGNMSKARRQEGYESSIALQEKEKVMKKLL
jgi:hypothetical protein